MEVATVRSIASFERLLYVSIPWIDRLEVSEDALLGRLVKKPNARHEHAYASAVEKWTPQFMSLMDPYREHERIVRDSLEDLVTEPFVLIDPVAYEDRPLGIEPHSPRNDVMTRIKTGIGRGRLFSVGPLIVPLDVADGSFSLPLEDVLDDRFASSEPWSGYYRFNPAIFAESSDPFDRDSKLDARARSALARGLIALRASAILDSSKGVRDEIRIFGFSNGVLSEALERSPLLDRTLFKQLGGRTSKGRRYDEQGLANPASLATLAAYFKTEPVPLASSKRPILSGTPSHPWLLEPYPGRFEIIMDHITRSYGEEAIDRFAHMMRDRGWGATHAFVRLASLERTRVSDAQRRSYALEDLVEDLGPSPLDATPLERFCDDRIIRPSDALTAPYDCALAHHVNALPSRLSLIASRIGSLPDDVREAFFEYRDEGLRSLWPVFGRIAHEVYAYPWVIFESDFSRYGSIGDLLEKSVEARVERDRPFVITTRSDVLLEGRSEGRVPVVIDRKLSGYTESMRHSHRTQLALTLAAYRERITADGDHMPYGIGIVDASAPYHPHPSGYRPQRFTARLFTNDEISESLERACDVALRRDAIRTRDDVLSAKQASAAYRTGPKGGRAASLCSSCGVYRSDGSVKGSLATRLACDTLTES